MKTYIQLVERLMTFSRFFVACSSDGMKQVSFFTEITSGFVWWVVKFPIKSWYRSTLTDKLLANGSMNTAETK
jgi:hypothetical protein